MRDLKTVLVLASYSLLGQTTASAGDSIDRLGRLWGFGWSDGYHACRDNGYEVGVNLPPLSYTHRNSLISASSRQHAMHVHGSVAPEGNCASGNCHQDWAPNAWQDNPNFGSPANMTPTIVPEPIPIKADPRANSLPNQPPVRETLPTPAPKPAKPIVKPELDDADLLLDDSDLPSPPEKPAIKKPILNDDDDLLLDEPESPSDSDLGAYLNSPTLHSPYQSAERPTPRRQTTSRR